MRIITKYLKLNDNENTAYKKPQGIARAVFRGKFTALSVHIRREKRFKSNYLSFHLKRLENKNKFSPQQIGRNDIINRNQ